MRFESRITNLLNAFGLHLISQRIHLSDLVVQFRIGLPEEMYNHPGSMFSTTGGKIVDDWLRNKALDRIILIHTGCVVIVQNL